jgi:hypothetical protein
VSSVCSTLGRGENFRNTLVETEGNISLGSDLKIILKWILKYDATI